jgi:hypothetical protein
MPRTTNAPATMKISAYVSATAYEALAKTAMAAGVSLSAQTTAILVNHLRRHGHAVEESEARARRTDFAPSKTLTAALARRAETLRHEAARTDKKIAQLKKRDA